MDETKIYGNPTKDFVFFRPIGEVKLKGSPYYARWKKDIYIVKAPIYLSKDVKEFGFLKNSIFYPLYNCEALDTSNDISIIDLDSFYADYVSVDEPIYKALIKITINDLENLSKNKVEEINKYLKDLLNLQNKKKNSCRLRKKY